MSPTASYLPLYRPCGSVPVGWPGGRVYPGWWDEGWSGRVLYRYPGPPSQIPIFNHILRLRPYPRPCKGNLRLNDEVS